MLFFCLVILSGGCIIFSFFAYDVLEPLHQGYFMQFSGIIFFLLLITIICKSNIKRKNDQVGDEDS